MFLYFLLFSSVLNVKQFKIQSNDNVIKSEKFSNLKLNLNNTHNQISLTFENIKNINLNNKNKDDIMNSNFNNKTIAEEVPFNIFKESSNRNNLNQKSKSINSDIEKKLEEKIIKKFVDSNVKKKDTINTESYREQEYSSAESINNIKNNNNNLNEEIKAFEKEQHIQKKIKYFDLLKNLKKVKSRMNYIKENILNNTNINSDEIANKLPSQNKYLNYNNQSNPLLEIPQIDIDSNISETDLNKIIDPNIKDEILFEEFLQHKNQSRKKKYSEDDNVFMFYNSLSLIMLSMLGGGVVGVIFILYFSFKHDNSNNLSN